MAMRKLQFAGHLLDGRSAKKHPVVVHLTPDSLTLKIEDGESLLWKHGSIDWNDITRPGQVRLSRSVEEAEGTRVESLIVEDPDFTHNLRETAGGKLNATWKGKNPFRHVALVLGLLGVPLFLYGIWSYGLPFLSDRAAKHVPVEWEVKLGDTLMEGSEMQVAGGDARKAKALDVIMARLLATVPDQPYTFKVYIAKDKMVNAFALPGGTILLYQGIIDAAQTPEELAGVLAHEIQHVLLRHSTRGIIRSAASGMLATLVIGDVNGVMNGVLELAGSLDQLKFSRSMEEEADRKGMEMMLAAGIDPVGMVRIFKALKKEQEAFWGKDESEKPSAKKSKQASQKKTGKDSENENTSWLEYLSTHPEPQNRIDRLKKQVENAGQTSYKPLLPDLKWKELFHTPGETP